MTTKQQNTENEIIHATKQFVTHTRNWATTVRDATWAPWESVVEQNETLAATMRPWFEMTKTAHDRWLDLYETQSHEMIDRTFTVVDRFRA